jgi:hypothetical protein
VVVASINITIAGATLGSQGAEGPVRCEVPIYTAQVAERYTESYRARGVAVDLLIFNQLEVLEHSSEAPGK